MPATIGTLAPLAAPVICDFSWDSGLPGYTYTIETFNYPPAITAYSASINYTPSADTYYSGNEYICLSANGPLTAVVTPGTNSAVWKKIPFRFFYYQAPLQQVITFDAIDSMTLNLPKVYTPPGVSIVSYQWNFGNGLLGYGSTATTTYTYNQSPPDTQVTLTIIDSLGRLFSCAHYVPLEQVAPTDTGYGAYRIGEGNIPSTYVRNVADTLGQGEAVARVFHGARATAEALAIAENVSRNPNRSHVPVTDTIGLSDAVTHSP